MLNDPLNIISLTGDGVQTVFDVPFKIWDVAELEVSILTASGASTIVSDWTATISPGGLGGTVTYPTSGDPLPSGDKIVVRRVVPIQQKVDLVHANRVLPDVVENALDRLTAMVAQNAEEVDRAVKGAPGQTATDYLNELEADRAAAELAAQNAQAAQTAAGQAQAAAEASAVRAEEAAEQAELPIVSPGDEGKVLTVSPSLEKEWAEVPEGLPPYSVADEGKILKVSSLGEVEWGVDEKELPPYTVLDAGKTLSVNEDGDAVEWVIPPKGGVNIPPQSIIKAALGPRPDGWTAADCDAPVASLSHSGNVVTVEAGLQVAYADGGNVYPSEVLAAPQSVDLSAAADGTHHVYADIAEDGTFSGFGHTDMAPEVGVERGRIGTQEDVTSVTADPTPISGDPNTLVNGSLSGYVQWSTPTPTVTFLGVGGRLQELSIFAPRAQNQLPKTWEVDGLSGGIWTKIGEGVTASVDDWTSDRYISTTITDSTTVYEQFRLRTTSSWGSGMIFTDVKFSALADPADLYNPATVTMYDKDDNPIRRVYLGWVEKSGGDITDVHCYSLGTVVTLPVTEGAPFPKNTNAVEKLPYVYFDGAVSNAQIFAGGMWGATGWMYYTNAGGTGLTSSVLESGIHLHSGAQAFSAQSSSTGGDFTSGSVAGPCLARVTVRRGF